ncbi:uncharacterized protein BYT42DRAFT_486207, partial [Radiomyces spectabilis]|uniref:uncharacterized protein n=1 Tax=Radiomyces spectabilis TaxID=64574 RepID=UPI00221F74E9
MPKKPISGVTDGMFLSENEVYDVIQQYMPSETLKQNDLAEWMSKDGFWGPAKRKQYRDFTWDDICNIQQFRAMVKASLSSIRTSGYGRKS